MIWPGQTVETSVRVDGIDTPEIRGKCQRENDLARVLLGSTVMLEDVRHGKYAGRVVARVILADGQDLSKVLIIENLGVPYDGGKRFAWCD